MSRLTKEQLEYYRNTYDKFDGIESNEFEEICNQLIEYKSLEEELGIDLPILFKAILGNVIYVKTKDDEFNIYAFYRNDRYEYEVNIKEKRIEIGFIDDEKLYYEYYDFKDYGKTWSLTIEVLRNE